MFYANDALVNLVTLQLLAGGWRILQIFQKDTEEDHVDFLLERFQPVGRTVLDVGCGTGDVARLMNKRRPDLKFHLLNFSPSQLALCPEHFDRIHADAHNIPLPDNAVDNVMACYVMGHLRKNEALREFERVVKPGGVIFIYDVTGGEIEELEYTAHHYENAEEVSDQVNCNRFLELMPLFRDKFPHIKPIIVRMEVR